MIMIYDSINQLSGGHSNSLIVQDCALFCFCAADIQKLRTTVLDSIQLICYACIWVNKSRYQLYALPRIAHLSNRLVIT
jgi:hypothetical protein